MSAPTLQANQPASPAELAARNGLQLSSIALEKTPGSSLVYAVGTITNTAERQRFGVTVDLEVLDASGQKVGTASDYVSVLEPKARWQFKALIVDPKTAASARLAAVREQQ